MFVLSAAQRRQLATLAVVVYGGLFAQTGLHALTTEHTVCAEHGELVHGAGHDEGEREPLAPDALLPVATDDAHGHCGHVHTSGLAAVGDAAVPLSAPLGIDTPLTLTGAARDAAAQQAALALAPKTSPPA